MSNEEDFEEFSTITMTDEETGDDIEFAIIDQVEADGYRYLLVIESELIDDDEAEAIILKEVADEGEELTYSLVEDDAEFDRVADLFQENSEDYDVEIDE